MTLITAERKDTILSAFILFLFAFLYAFFNSKNSPLYLFNEWGDVNIYFSMGKGMANNLVLYRDIFDHKGPLIFFLYSLAYHISNTDFVGVYIIESLFLGLNLLFAYKLAKLYLNNLFSFITALIYALFLFLKSYYGGSAEEFISLFITISFYYFIVYFINPDQSKRISYKQMFIHGLMFGFAFLSKLSICVFWIPLMLAVLIDLGIKKDFCRVVLFGVYFLFGFVVSLLPFLVYFLVNNSLSDAYFGYITFNSLYAEFNPDLLLVRKIAAHFYKLILYDYISFPLLLLGLFLLSFTKKYIRNISFRIGIFFSFCFSFSVFCIAKYIMTYAHIVMYVYVIFGVIFLFQIAYKYIKVDRYKPIYYFLSFFIILGLGTKEKSFFDQDFNCLLRKKECNYMQKEFASIINKEENPTLLNIGLDFGIFTAANLQPSYKYFFYPNVPYHVFPDIRDYQVDLIAKKDPMFIVIGDKSAFYDMYKDMPSLKENYELVSVYYQNDPVYDNRVFLYKRK